jgi:hypothetical protein
MTTEADQVDSRSKGTRLSGGKELELVFFRCVETIRADGLTEEGLGLEDFEGAHYLLGCAAGGGDVDWTGRC